MTKADLIALADRCMKAEGPDRKLDNRVYAWLQGHTGFEWTGYYYRCDQVAGSNGGDVPRYTASVDAALMLVGQRDWVLSVASGEPALCTLPAGYGLDDAVHGYANSAALAITAAALLARAEEIDDKAFSALNLARDKIEAGEHKGG